MKRLICSLLGHPWLDQVSDRDVKCCPCGRSEITGMHLILAWPK